jgi:hypothetical protein
MTNVDKKVTQFGKPASERRLEKKALVDERDGLFEQHEVVNRRLVSQDGRQLLREQNHEEA